MTVSVIIPVYNVKPYLERCVNSVLDQSYKDLEIILVDDGSTDGSGELCEQIATRDLRVSVIHQENQGISGARNTGLKHATGMYVVFLDADDAWLLTDGIEKLMAIAIDKTSDIVIFKCVHIWNGCCKNKTQDYDIEQIDSLRNCSDVFMYLIKTQQFNMSACLLLVRRQLLIDYEIFFPIGYISEDVYWSLHLWQYIKTLSVTNLEFYGYYHREASVSTTPSIKVYDSYDKIFSFWKGKCEEGCQNAEAIRFYLANMWVSRGYAYDSLINSEKPKALQILRKHVDLLDYGHSPKSRRLQVMVKYFGVRFTVVMLGWYWFLRNHIKRSR